MSKGNRPMLLCFSVLLVSPSSVAAFHCPASPTHGVRIRRKHPYFLEPTSGNDGEVPLTTYESSGSSSKGVVSSLTGLVNFMMGSTVNESRPREQTGRGTPPGSPERLLEKIRDDYVLNNYLWTGDIYTPAFEEDCRFTDPTLSFVGRDKFVSNVQNLRPIVDFLRGDGVCRSDLLDIRLNEKHGYVQSRWNMVGELNRLPWRPKIDVIGRTRFWYRGESAGSADDDGDRDRTGVRIFFYDEEWGIPSGRALLQLVTPAGTIANQPKE